MTRVTPDRSLHDVAHVSRGILIRGFEIDSPLVGVVGTNTPDDGIQGLFASVANRLSLRIARIDGNHVEVLRYETSQFGGELTEFAPISLESQHNFQDGLASFLFMARHSVCNRVRCPECDARNRALNRKLDLSRLEAIRWVYRVWIGMKE